MRKRWMMFDDAAAKKKDDDYKPISSYDLALKMYKEGGCLWLQI